MNFLLFGVGSTLFFSSNLSKNGKQEKVNLITLLMMNSEFSLPSELLTRTLNFELNTFLSRPKSQPENFN
jgi:hypothetical protein